MLGERRGNKNRREKKQIETGRKRNGKEEEKRRKMRKKEKGREGKERGKRKECQAVSTPGR